MPDQTEQAAAAPTADGPCHYGEPHAWAHHHPANSPVWIPTCQICGVVNGVAIAEDVQKLIDDAVAKSREPVVSGSSPRAGERPTIVCLCGSTRFYDAFQEANYRETMAGRIVLSVGFYPHAKAEHGHGEGVGHDSTEKVALDELHKRKIDLADEVYVLNVGGYLGDSTRSEVAYARAMGKPIRWLEPDSAEAVDSE
jgi:hypothetical protein